MDECTHVGKTNELNTFQGTLYTTYLYVPSESKKILRSHNLDEYCKYVRFMC